MGVAQTYGLDFSGPVHSKGEHGHGVGVVDEQCIGTNLLHILGKVQHHRDCPQCPENTADAIGIADSLPQAVLFGNLEVCHGAGLVAAHLNGIDHIFGSTQCLFAVGIFNNLRPTCVGVAVDGGEHHVRLFQALGINVKQRVFVFPETVGLQTVAEHILGENTAACAQECYLVHCYSPFLGFYKISLG